ncbi:MAG: hypothetical protein J0H68_02435 [Sphingobacteriia bacterium]|nr:hypothetical protein [Sphingobacteriia bacterium]
MVKFLPKLPEIEGSRTKKALAYTSLSLAGIGVGIIMFYLQGVIAVALALAKSSMVLSFFSSVIGKTIIGWGFGLSSLLGGAKLLMNFLSPNIPTDFFGMENQLHVKRERKKDVAQHLAKSVERSEVDESKKQSAAEATATKSSTSLVDEFLKMQKDGQLLTTTANGLKSVSGPVNNNVPASVADQPKVRKWVQEFIDKKLNAASNNNRQNVETDAAKQASTWAKEFAAEEWVDEFLTNKVNEGKIDPNNKKLGDKLYNAYEFIKAHNFKNDARFVCGLFAKWSGSAVQALQIKGGNTFPEFEEVYNYEVKKLVKQAQENTNKRNGLDAEGKEVTTLISKL